MRKVVTFLVILGILFGCFSCSRNKEEKKEKVSVVLMALNSDYWNMVSTGAKKAGEKLGVEVDVLGPSTETMVVEQVGIVENQIVAGASAIVLAALQPAAMMPVLNTAVKSKVPVVLIDTAIPEFKEQISYVGTVNIDGGAAAGKYLAENLQEGSKVAIVRGVEGSPTHDDRAKGCIDTLKDAGIEVVSIQPANSFRDLAMTVTENILQAFPDVKGIYATNDEMALGALKAVEGAQRKDIIVIGFDGAKDALESIKDGALSATVAQNPINEGYLGVEAAVKALRGERVEKRIDTGIEIVTKENVNEFQENIDKQMRL
jgi:ribose transport system substrate-binding protein